MMETENGNRFYDESGNQEEQENSFNRFNGNSDGNNQGTNRREGRPRFVRVDYNNRPQYSRVERPQRREDGDQQGYGQRQGGYQNRGYNNNRPQYGQQRYGQPRQYNNGETESVFRARTVK